MKKRRVVVTGLGAITPIGNNVNDFWSNLVAGKNGVELISKFNTSKFDTKFAAEVRGFDPSSLFDKKALRRIDTFAQYALYTANEAILDSAINFEQIDKNRFGVIYGSGIGGIKSFEEQNKLYFQTDDPSKISPFLITMFIADIAAGLISIKYGLKGPNYSTTSACATASHAIADAMMNIERGNADIILTGGSEASITEISIGGFGAMRALSTWNDRYKEASRPFDKDRSGFVMGEGSGTLILEELEHAKNRGAKIYAELSGIGLTADAHHITAPDPEGDGAVRSMMLSITDAEISVNDIDYINAHGTSTPYNDVTETKAIKKVFQNHAYDLVVSSIKSMTGHLLGAAGGVEAIATILAVKNDIVPPTINLDNPDPECDLNYSPNKFTAKKINAAICNTFGFGGHNASLLFTKYRD
ncbi:MAG: beta-ketoacyl-[acyl-carrier-protein] synthase II [Chlorobiaceae bacterium]|nr:beta-ketoacyl-[acyl-carrier-protein] synthase II [Chlorobiaceae bacterium]MBA4309637.1 beta-ketoacyl-[acyl-carrier-protein] synthase II [Chlorobiaceae bacterium]